MTIQDHYNYFRLLLQDPNPATGSPLADLQSELGSPHSEAEIEQRVLMGEVEEFFQQFRSGVRFPCLIVEGSEVEYGGEWRAQRWKLRRSAVIVADTYDRALDYHQIAQKLGHCEQIGELLLRQMMHDVDAAHRHGAGTSNPSNLPDSNSPLSTIYPDGIPYDHAIPFTDLRLDAFAATYLDNSANRYLGYRLTFEGRQAFSC